MHLPSHQRRVQAPLLAKTRLPSPRTFLLWLFLLSLLRSSVSGHSVSSSSRRASTPTTTVSHHNPLSPANTDADGTLLSRRHATQALACRFGVVATCLLGQSISVGTWHPAPCEAAAPPPFFSNPFVAFETVDQIPREYFDQRRSIYAFVDKVIDGDTLRVHHIPGYRSWGLLGSDPPQPLTSRKLSDKTLLIRLYGVDAPETAKKGGSNPDPEGQPFGQEAKEFTASLVYHQMVRVTFLRKDQYQRAICQVETVPDASSSSAGLLSFLSWFPGLGPKDLSVELAAAGLAELYVGGGAEYNNNREVLEKWIDRAQRKRKGQWYVDAGSRVSAAEYKRRKRAASAEARTDAIPAAVAAV